MKQSTEENATQLSRRGWRRLAITVALLVTSIGIGEVVVRIAVPTGRLMRIDQLDEALSGDYRSQFLLTIQDDIETFWRFTPNLDLPAGKGPFFGRVSNDQGLREREHIAVPKPAGELRVLFLGDSCTYGYGLDERHTFVAMAEEKLRTRFPNQRIECINAGVPGYSAYQCWRRLMTEGLAYEPDLVVMQSGWNEGITWDGRSDIEHHQALRASQPPAILAASRLCQLLWTHSNWPDPATQKRPRLTPAEFHDTLQRIEAAAKSRGAELLLLLTGSRNNLRTEDATELQRVQLRFARERSFGPDRRRSAFVDGVTILGDLVLNQKRPVESLLLDNAHPTMSYNELLSDALVARIAPWIEQK